MPFSSVGGIRYYRFERLGTGLVHAVFTRWGGVSPIPWKSLNLGSTVGDDLVRVEQNRSLALAAIGCSPAAVYDVWQVHGVEVAIADGPRPPGTAHMQADAILTNRTGLTLMMRFADCVPILLHDPVSRVVGIVHAGWLGTVRGTVSAAVERMRTQYGSAPADVIAAVGPSIGPDHYEVGLDVAAQVRQAFGGDAEHLLRCDAEAVKFDLWAANRLLLEKAGVRQIELAGICTACHLEDWFSHRAEKGRTGRFGAAITLV